MMDGLSKGLYTYSLTFNLSLFRSLISDQVSDCSLVHCSVGLLFMPGSRKLCQRGSNFDDIFF